MGKYNFLKKSSFWNKILLIALPVVMIIAVLFISQSVVLRFRDAVLNNVFAEAKSNIRVFLHTVELQEGHDDPAWVLYVLKDMVAVNDSEKTTNCLLLDSEYTCASRRTAPDYNYPDDAPDVKDMYAELAKKHAEGEFILSCNGFESPWFYKRITLDEKEYIVLVGIRANVLNDIVPVNDIYVPIFIFGLLVAASLEITVFEIVRRGDANRKEMKK